MIYRYATQSVERINGLACQGHVKSDPWRGRPIKNSLGLRLWFLAERLGLPSACFFSGRRRLAHPRLMLPPRDPLFYSSRAGAPLVMIFLETQSSKDQAARCVLHKPRIAHCGAHREHCNPHHVSMAEEAGGRAVRVGLQQASHAASTSLMLFSLLLYTGISSSIRRDFGYRPRLSN